jgi:hypothetical protein
MPSKFRPEQSNFVESKHQPLLNGNDITEGIKENTENIPKRRSITIKYSLFVVNIGSQKKV